MASCWKMYEEIQGPLKKREKNIKLSEYISLILGDTCSEAEHKALLYLGNISIAMSA